MLCSDRSGVGLLACAVLVRLWRSNQPRHFAATQDCWQVCRNAHAPDARNPLGPIECHPAQKLEHTNVNIERRGAQLALALGTSGASTWRGHVGDKQFKLGKQKKGKKWPLQREDQRQQAVKQYASGGAVGPMGAEYRDLAIQAPAPECRDEQRKGSRRPGV